MSDLNKLKVVDFTAGRLSSDDINTNIPFADNFDKTRTIQQANAVIGAYVNRNYTDMQNKANIDDIPTKTSQLVNDSGYITTGDIPSKTSDLTNDGADGEHPFITKEVDNLTNYTTSSGITDLLEPINNNITDLQDDVYDINGDIARLNDAVDLQLPGRVGDLVVDSIITRNLLNPGGIRQGTVSATDGSYSNNAVVVVSNFIEVKANTNYTIKLNNVDDNQFLLRIVLYKPNKTFDNVIVNNVQVTQYNFTPTRDGYIRLCFGKGSWDNLTPIDIIKANPQLEKGTATPYKPYQNLNAEGTVLYDNSNGSNDSITLSDSSENYTYLEIFYRQQDYTYSFTKVSNPNGKTVILIGYHVTNNGGAIGISAKNVSISGTSITTALTNRYMVSNIVQNNTLTGGSQTNNIFITKVVGYK